MRTKFNMRKTDPKVKKAENLDLMEITLDRKKVEEATKLLPPVPKKLKTIKEEQPVRESASYRYAVTNGGHSYSYSASQEP